MMMKMNDSEAEEVKSGGGVAVREEERAHSL